ncbi:MAG: GNAT family N-acetyltransferase [Caldilineaceae bacterium]
MQIVELSHSHAAAAAHLHIAGQPGTFLTSLGADVLTVFYGTLSQSTTGFGFAALASAATAGTTTEIVISHDTSTKVHSDETPGVMGFIAATTSTGHLFFELGTRHLAQFLPVLLRQVIKKPGLLWQLIQTLFYPLRGQPNASAKVAQPAQGQRVELLSVMVAPTNRGRGIGAELLQQLMQACQVRQISIITVTVAMENHGARRFYARHGFVKRHHFELYGRAMCSYQLDLTRHSMSAPTERNSC